MHFGRIGSPENASSGCKCRFIVVNRRVLNHMRNFQAAEKDVATSGAPPAHAAAYGVRIITLQLVVIIML